MSSDTVRTTQLLKQGTTLATPQVQQQMLVKASLGADFAQTLAVQGWEKLLSGNLEIFQINLGKLCNMTCRHCHVDSGPHQVTENMDRQTVDLCLVALDQTTAHTVDLTGGAPELNPHFQYLVEQCVARGKQVIDRCNLTVLLLPKFRDLPQWFAKNGVQVVCSLPHYRPRNTDAQRGAGTFEQSITALRLLNQAGYGQGDAQRQLTLISNPVGAFLAGNQNSMESEWKAYLDTTYGVTFDRLICLNNMPIARYLEWLVESGNLEQYMQVLINSFNPTTIGGLMCRNTLSISWDGYIYDCDFNQMLTLNTIQSDGRIAHIRDFQSALLSNRIIPTGPHCFGCTAGAGSSCGGQL